MLLVAEILTLCLLSSFISTPESFAYLFATYIIVKIARSWFKGCLPAALVQGGGSDDEDYDLLGTYVIAYCHIILWIDCNTTSESHLPIHVFHTQNEYILCAFISISSTLAKPASPTIRIYLGIVLLTPPSCLQIQQVKDTRQQPIIRLVQ